MIGAAVPIGTHHFATHTFPLEKNVVEGVGIWCVGQHSGACRNWVLNGVIALSFRRHSPQTADKQLRAYIFARKPRIVGLFGGG